MCQIGVKKWTLQRGCRYVVCLGLVLFTLFKIAPMLLDTILSKYEQEQAWRQSRLEENYGKEIEEFRRSQSKEENVYYDEDNNCIKNCHLEIK